MKEAAACVASATGYHVYRTIWDAAIGEDLVCEREPSNEHNRYAIAIKKDGVIIGYLPQKISRLCTLFLWRGSSIACHVAGPRRYSADLSQGGLKISCVLRFEREAKEIVKI